MWSWRFFCFYIIHHVVIRRRISWRRRIYPRRTFQSLWIICGRKGFVVLTEDENDRRKRHIELTEKAVEAAKEMLEVHNDCKACCHAVCDGGGERQLWTVMMQKMLRSLDEELQK